MIASCQLIICQKDWKFFHFSILIRNASNWHRKCYRDAGSEGDERIWYWSCKSNIETSNGRAQYVKRANFIDHWSNSRGRDEGRTSSIRIYKYKYKYKFILSTWFFIYFNLLSSNNLEGEERRAEIHLYLYTCIFRYLRKTHTKQKFLKPRFEKI